MTAEYRSVQTRMWREDEWFQSLDTDARLLFIYLFTNPSASIAGIYRLPLRTIEFESGLDKARITELLAQFSTANKAHYADGVVWVVRMRENQIPGAISPKVQVRLDKDIAAIPHCPLKIRYLKHYGYPIDTVSILDRTDTDTDTDTEKEGTQPRPSPAAPNGVVPSAPKPQPSANTPPPLSPDAAKYGAFVTMLEQAFAVSISPTLGDFVAEWVNAVTEQEWVYALGECKAHRNGFVPKYVSSILRRVTAERLTPMAPLPAAVVNVKPPEVEAWPI